MHELTGSVKAEFGPNPRIHTVFLPESHIPHRCDWQALEKVDECDDDEIHDAENRSAPKQDLVPLYGLEDPAEEADDGELGQAYSEDDGSRPNSVPEVDIGFLLVRQGAPVLADPG